jgi:hypothetical protein
VAGQPAPVAAFLQVAEPESEGGGLFVTGASSGYTAFMAVVAGNSVGDDEERTDGDGGGIYVGAPAQQGTQLELNDSTVAGNSVGSDGAFPGISGGGNDGDSLAMTNSIVYNGPLPDIGGFGSFGDIAFTDACQVGDPGFHEVAGPGNICQDPLLADPENGNIHQTASSPTIDQASDNLWNGHRFEDNTDFEGDPRPVDNDGDGHTADMGADEVRVRPSTPPPGKPSGGLTGAVLGASASGSHCGRRAISLVRADTRGGRVVLKGLVGASLEGKKVTVRANYRRGGKVVSKTVRADGSGRFTARVKRPSRRDFRRARYRAKAGSARSVALRLYQSLATRSVKQKGGKVVVRGKIRRALVGRRNRVVIRRLVCGHYRTVGSARPSRSGRYVVTFKVPNLGGVALYRAESRVLRRAGSRVYVKQYARAVSITLTDQTG